ncbi:MAG TPA: cytochrome c1 [Gallionella sp.]|nr:cytochrome c1 [Gallionella sp.]
MRTLIALVFFCFSFSPVWAEEAMLEDAQVDTSLPTVERGVEDLMNNCHNCHTLKYIHFRDLAKFGIERKKIDEWRGDQTMDAPLASLMSDEVAMQSFGLVPPDLSLMTKAREGGADYVYSYLLGYYSTPDGETKNHIFPETKMPDPLGISTTTDHAQREEIRKTAHDIVSFLSWAADPHEQERRWLGYYVIGYLLILTGLLYFVKNQIWARLN